MCHDEPTLEGLDPDENERGNAFAFVVSRLNVTARIPSVLITNHLLRRANDEEIPRIKAFLSGIGQHGEFRYETHICEDGAREDLPESEWRYFVIERDKRENLATGDITAGFRAIETASLLAGVWIRCPVIFHRIDKVSYGGTLGHDWFRDTPEVWNEALQLGDQELFQIQHLGQAIPAITKKYEDIARAIDAFTQVSLIPSAHFLYALGLFSVIEMLLTHNPHAEHDSLTHQIASKFPLLDKRFRKPIDYGDFNGASPATVWKALYGYRSVIAHGGKIDFKEGKLKILGDAATAHRFLHDALLILLQHSLEEPELLLDLRGV